MYVLVCTARFLSHRNDYNYCPVLVKGTSAVHRKMYLRLHKDVPLKLALIFKLLLVMFRI